MADPNKADAAISGDSLMLKKLRRKFIALNMATVFVVLLIAFSAICYTQYQRDKSDLEEALTSSLEFYPNMIRSFETGLVAIEGRTVGKSPINVRAKPKNGSRILGSYVVGTPLTIFSRDDQWCEVDVEGSHCYILTEYVELSESGSATASK